MTNSWKIDYKASELTFYIPTWKGYKNVPSSDAYSRAAMGIMV